jgi:hypothetical protein
MMVFDREICGNSPQGEWFFNGRITRKRYPAARGVFNRER